MFGSTCNCVAVITIGRHSNHEVTTNCNLAYGTVGHIGSDTMTMGGKKC